jgi:hypothetical protein
MLAPETQSTSHASVGIGWATTLSDSSFVTTPSRNPPSNSDAAVWKRNADRRTEPSSLMTRVPAMPTFGLASRKSSIVRNVPGFTSVSGLSMKT